jgi:hypothetical protein
LNGWPLDELVADALVIPLSVIVVHELSYEAPKVPLAHRYDPIEAFRPLMSYELAATRNEQGGGFENLHPARNSWCTAWDIPWLWTTRA